MLSSPIAVTSPWFEPFVWTDYRLAVLFSVILPLILLIWAFVQKADALIRLLTIYWRVASLLAITVYLMIGAFPISFLTAFSARFLIPISLWFWVDLNEEIEDRPASALKLTFTAWRWAITVYSILGTFVQIPFLTCGFKTSTQQLLDDSFCRVWLDPPWLYKEIFHANSGVQFLGFLGIVGLIFYVFCLGYFVLFKLSKQGRSATGN